VAHDPDAAPEGLLIATGSELHLCLEAARLLAQEGKPVRVVSMPSWELFEAQPESYRQSVLPRDLVRRLAVEAGSALGWSRYVGQQGTVVGVDRFGASAPEGRLFTEFGFTPEAVAKNFTKMCSP
jgi:transketolase